MPKVTNPETNQPYQCADLDVSYRKHGNDKKYPTRQVSPTAITKYHISHYSLGSNIYRNKVQGDPRLESISHS